MTQPVKPFASIDEQIDVLASRRLALDRAAAEQWLRNVSYYRLSGYWYPYRVFEVSDRPRRLDAFIPSANFTDVTLLYEFDRKLRTLIHDGIERVEVALRSHLSYVIGEAGPLAYRDATKFRPTFDHAGWLETAHIRAERARRHSEPIRHHQEKYDGALPIWVLTEVLDFSDVSRLYDGLPAREQWMVAERLGIHIDGSQLNSNQRAKVRKNHPLARWLEQLTVLRNTCAHHSRVWNRSFAPVSTAGLRTLHEFRSLPEGQSERLYGALLLIGYLLQMTSPGTSWTLKLRGLVEESFLLLPERDVSEMGFPPNWVEESLWALPAATRTPPGIEQ